MKFDVEDLVKTPAPELPSYNTPGNMLVRIYPRGWRGKREIEIIDWARDSAIFWLMEGFPEYWLEDHVRLPPGSGMYVIVGIQGAYHRGTWGYDDDDEEWWYKRVRKAYPSQIKHECL